MEGRERQTHSCQSACEEPADPQGRLALSSHLCVCVCELEGQKWQQYSYVNMSYGLTYTQKHTHMHTTHLIASRKKKKRSVSRAPLCLMCSTLILPFGDICCCVNYTPPGVLINTHAMTCTSLHTEIPNALYVRGSGMNGGAGMSLKYPKLSFKSP